MRKITQHHARTGDYDVFTMVDYAARLRWRVRYKYGFCDLEDRAFTHAMWRWVDMARRPV